jgi:hypothetical protein
MYQRGRQKRDKAQQGDGIVVNFGDRGACLTERVDAMRRNGGRQDEKGKLAQLDTTSHLHSRISAPTIPIHLRDAARTMTIRT